MLHIPVLLNEVVKYLDPKPGQKFIDATINGGGHAKKILERILPGGRLLGIEIDPRIYRKALSLFKEERRKNYITIIRDSYARLGDIAQKTNFTGADGILFDLGMSSWHIEESGKGFSFAKPEPLDMRFYGCGITAADVLNSYKLENLQYIIREYGGEKFAGNISKEIVNFRKNKPFENTFELVGAIKKSVPSWYLNRRVHFATKTFQALRIEVNQELKNIQKGLEEAVGIVKPGGKVAVISFHSLEDKIVKNQFRSWGKEGKGMIITKNPVKPTPQEVKENPRSRSSKLRVFKIAVEYGV